jgi:hypothetical protein
VFTEFLGGGMALKPVVGTLFHSEKKYFTIRMKLEHQELPKPQIIIDTILQQTHFEKNHDLFYH